MKSRESLENREDRHLVESSIYFDLLKKNQAFTTQVFQNSAEVFD